MDVVVQDPLEILSHVVVIENKVRSAQQLVELYEFHQPQSPAIFNSINRQFLNNYLERVNSQLKRLKKSSWLFLCLLNPPKIGFTQTAIVLTSLLCFCSGK